jgi:hypothetical protein
MNDPSWYGRLALLPDRVIALGESWRVLSFLAVPLSTNPLWLLLILWFVYYIVDTLEREWGSVALTLYTLIAILFTVAASIGLGVAILNPTELMTSYFLAVAVLYPDQEVRLYMAIPVRMKWLGFLSGAYILYRLVVQAWPGPLLIVACYMNFLLFFSPLLITRFRQWRRRARWRSNFKD